VPSAQEWIERYAGRLGMQPPEAADVEVLLAMTGIAAHASERTAAPISAWLAARAGVSALEAREHASALAAEFAAEAASGEDAGGTGASATPGGAAAP
jgi:hypothetical protein